MNYNELSLDELKDLAKTKGISIGNSGKEKIIEKLANYDSEESAKSLLKSSNIIDDITKSNDLNTNNNEIVKTTKDNLIEAITDVVSDLDDFQESDEKDSTIEDINMDEEVPCMSIVFGGLTYVSPLTGAKYKWHKIGDVEYMTVKELVSMNNSKPIFLNRPWIILQDIRAVNKFRLISKYEEVAKINSLKKLFSSNDMNLIETTVDTAIRSGMREVIISKVRTMYNNGVLSNTHIIKMLENKLKFDLITE